MSLITEKWRRFVNEGGNVFKGERVDSIPLEFIEPTLDRYYEELSRLFPNYSGLFQTFAPLGSVGKKAKSGDIDLAVDVQELFPSGQVNKASLQSWGLDPQSWQETYDRMYQRARTATEVDVQLRAFLYEIAKYIGENSKMIKTDLKQVGPGLMFSLFPHVSDTGEQQDVGVQIDWMLGNKNWLKFSYSSPFPSEQQPMLKGLHRTQLILAMFGAKGYAFKHRTGVYDKTTGEKVASNAEEVSSLLEKIYGAPITSENLESFSTIYDWLMANATEEDINGAFDSYLRILDSTRGNKETDPATGQSRRCGYVPEELEDYWLQNWQRLGLKGKFLCKSVNQRLGDAISEIREAKKWSKKYKRSINCSSPKGFSQKQYCKRQKRGGSYKS